MKTEKYRYLGPEGDLGGETWDVWLNTETGKREDYPHGKDPNALGLIWEETTCFWPDRRTTNKLIN